MMYATILVSIRWHFMIGNNNNNKKMFATRVLLLNLLKPQTSKQSKSNFNDHTFSMHDCIISGLHGKAVALIIKSMDAINLHN